MPLKVKLSAGDVDIDQARIERFMKDPEGPVVKDLRRRGESMERAMVVPRDTGLLASTKRTEMDLTGRMPAVECIVGRDGVTPYVGYLINGTRPHEIRPRTAKALRFVSGGQVLFRARVQHPGYAGSDFMQRALRAAVD